MIGQIKNSLDKLYKAYNADTNRNKENEFKTLVQVKNNEER
jgi:hypothetical protein